MSEAIDERNSDSRGSMNSRESELYSRRFSSHENETRRLTWQVLCAEFLQKRIPLESTVLDLGAGDGNFITHIECRKKIAVDLSEHALFLKELGIETHIVSATEFAGRLEEPVDIVFMSNFLEHLPSKGVVLQVLTECHNALRPDGRIIILQPNIRYVGNSYWDYIDHHIALTEDSLAEALEISGFDIVELIPRFFPYTAKSKLGRWAGGKKVKFLVSLYLKCPWVWRIMGGQTFLVARKAGAN